MNRPGHPTLEQGHPRPDRTTTQKATFDHANQPDHRPTHMKTTSAFHAHELARTLARCHRIDPDQVYPLPQGQANHVLALGETLVLRVARTPLHAADLEKEAELLPLAHTAGLPVPELVDHAQAPVPHLLITRLPGTDMAGRTPTRTFLRQVGRQLHRLHNLPTHHLTTPPLQAEQTDPTTLVQDLHRTGMLDTSTAAWLTDHFHHLAAHTSRTPPEPVLIHGDLSPTNLLATPDGALSAIVDLGDAALAEAAVDFAKLPPHWLPEVLAGYPTAPGQEHSLQARILHHHLTWALARLADPAPCPEPRHWSAPPASRLVGLLRLAATHPWPHLLQS